MIPILYNEDMTEKLGLIVETKNARVTEVANGVFDYEFEYPIDSPLTNIFENQQIIVVDASEELKAQKFRIFEIEKRLKTSILVRAQHRFFDLRKDSIEVLSLEHETCEYAVNQIFKNSDHSQDFKGYSDIVNAQGYYNKDVSCLEAIVGKEGSIIDTYGNGAQLLRDNENVHVLKKRGQHRDVTIEYGKNMTGFKLTEDFTNVFTRIKPYAIKRAEGDTPETIIRGGVVDSPRIGNYRMIMTKNVDYTSKFEQGEEITVEKLRAFAQQEYDINHVDVPKVSADVSFIPLQKCVGYKGQFDNIGLFDTVIVKHKKYNYETEIRVVEYVYDPIKERPHSMKLGDARESLASIIGGGNNNAVTKDEVMEIVNGVPQKPPKYPDTLPVVPQLGGQSIGLNTLELTWSHDPNPAYVYELYANKDPEFEPKEFDLIFEGKGSAHSWSALPNESWTFVVCAKNTYGKRTLFSNRVTLETAKIDASTFIKEATIGNALIGNISADKLTAGTINVHLLDLRNYRQTNGDGKITLDINSNGDLYGDFNSLTIKGQALAQEGWVNTQIKNSAEGLKTEVSNEYATKTEVTQAVDKWKIDFSTPTSNLTANSIWNKSLIGWFKNGTFVYDCFGSYTWINHDRNTLWIKNESNMFYGLFQPIKFIPGKTYTLFFKYQNDGGFITGAGTLWFGMENLSTIKRSLLVADGWHTERITFTATQNEHTLIMYLAHGAIYAEYMQIVEGNPENIPPWTPHANEVINAGTEITEAGILVKNGAIRIRNQSEYDVFWVDQYGQLCTDNVYIYGAEKEANLEIGGTGNKGIGIRSHDNGERYLDFCTLPKGTTYDENVRSGNLTRLYAKNGDFYIMPTNVLNIMNCRAGMGNWRLQQMNVHADEAWYAGNLTAGGTLIAQDALRCRNIAHPDGGAGYVIHVHAKLNLMDGTTFSAGVYANTLARRSFAAAPKVRPEDIIDNIEVIEKQDMLRTSKFSAKASKESAEELVEEPDRLILDVTNVIGTPCASIDEGGAPVASYEELLKVALMEIKSLKARVAELENKTV